MKTGQPRRPTRSPDSDDLMVVACFGRALVAGLILCGCCAACSADADRALRDMPEPAGAQGWVPRRGAVARPLTPPPLADRVVVFPAERAAELLAQCRRWMPGPVQGTWLPDQASLARLEDALGPAFTSAIGKVGFHMPTQHSLDDYYRQYGGFVVGGRRVVCINAFHGQYLDFDAQVSPLDPFDWRHRAVQVADGGALFFGAEFDVESGMITAIAFNGPG
jgi:hypothetical protein